MKKIRLLLLAIFLLVPSLSYSGWPINITPEVEGTVTDSVSHKPIENAEIYISYWKSAPLRGEYFGTGAIGIHNKTIYTDAEGKYRITHKTSIHLLSSFSWFHIHYITHPLYRMKNYELGDQLPSWSRKAGVKGKALTWNVEMESLKSAYTKGDTQAHSKEFYSSIRHLLFTKTHFDKLDKGKLKELFEEFVSICNILQPDVYQMKTRYYLKLLSDKWLFDKEVPDLDLRDHQIKGIKYWEQNRYDKAIIEFRKVIEECENKLPDMEDDMYRYQYSLIATALIYLEMGNIPKAEKHYNDLIAINPDKLNFHSVMALKLEYEKRRGNTNINLKF